MKTMNHTSITLSAYGTRARVRIRKRWRVIRIGLGVSRLVLMVKHPLRS